MELHPILESQVCPNPGLWYVLSALGECPGVRVGHTCTYLPGPEGGHGRVVVIGGANPNGPFAETYVLDLATFSWDRWDIPGLRPRYEHAAFSPSSQPNKIYIFGGADQGGNHSDIQVLDVDRKSWSTLTAAGSPPSARTFHTTASLGDHFYVYSGGHCVSDPVGDRQVHRFDAKTSTWSVLNVRGDAPKPRLGHVMVAVGNKILLHGGMSGTTFYDDLHVLDPAVPSWTKVKQKKNHPSGRAAHGAITRGDNVYIFGGMNRNGALDEMFKLDTNTMQWSRLCLGGPPPACRLDFGICVIQLRVPLEAPSDAEISASRSQAKDILDSQLRLGSAGSGHSVGSAGSQHSLGSYGSLNDGRGHSVGSAGSQHSGGSYGSLNDCLGASAPAADLLVQGEQLSTQELQGEPTAVDFPLCEEGAAVPEEAAAEDHHDDMTEYKTLELCLVLGGMDTEGEIFDDALAIVLQ